MHSGNLKGVFSLKQWWICDSALLGQSQLSFMESFVALNMLTWRKERI
jgi:hypothetical protein